MTKTRIDAAFLKQFCSEDTGYSLSKPHVFVHPETGRKYSYGTDGHRLVIVDGAIEGCNDYQEFNIAKFLIEPCGIEVPCVELKAFLECDNPCTVCGGKGMKPHNCNCELCQVGEIKCGCDGRPQRFPNYGWLGIAGINRALLSDVLRDVSDETVRIQITGPDDCIHIFASDRHVAVMPVFINAERFKNAPRFTVATGEVK